MSIKMIFNDFANMCGYLQNPEQLEHINNGYTCIHPQNEEREEIDGIFMITASIGKCYCFSCPLGIQDPDNEEMIIIDNKNLIEKIKKTDYWFKNYKEKSLS